MVILWSNISWLATNTSDEDRNREQQGSRADHPHGLESNHFSGCVPRKVNRKPGNAVHILCERIMLTGEGKLRAAMKAWYMCWTNYSEE